MNREQAAETLRRIKLKVTPRRLEIMHCLENESSFLSAEEIRQRLRQNNTTIGLPTVYRILDELTESGIITRIFMPDHKQYFFLCSSREHHHHFVCESCRNVQEVEHCGLNGVIIENLRRSGARITSHILQINGICGACNAKREKTA